MPSKTCPKCGEEVEASDTGRPCDSYYCDCGWNDCDITGWAERHADHADYLRKAAKEGVR